MNELLQMLAQLAQDPNANVQLPDQVSGALNQFTNYFGQDEQARNSGRLNLDVSKSIDPYAVQPFRGHLGYEDGGRIQMREPNGVTTIAQNALYGEPNFPALPTPYGKQPYDYTMLPTFPNGGMASLPFMNLVNMPQGGAGMYNNPFQGLAMLNSYSADNKPMPPSPVGPSGGMGLPDMADTVNMFPDGGWTVDQFEGLYNLGTKRGRRKQRRLERRIDKANRGQKYANRELQESLNYKNMMDLRGQGYEIELSDPMKGIFSVTNPTTGEKFQYNPNIESNFQKAMNVTGDIAQGVVKAALPILVPGAGSAMVAGMNMLENATQKTNPYPMATDISGGAPVFGNQPTQSGAASYPYPYPGMPPMSYPYPGMGMNPFGMPNMAMPMGYPSFGDMISGGGYGGGMNQSGFGNILSGLMQNPAIQNLLGSINFGSGGLGSMFGFEDGGPTTDPKDPGIRARIRNMLGLGGKEEEGYRGVLNAGYVAPENPMVRQTQYSPDPAYTGSVGPYGSYVPRVPDGYVPQTDDEIREMINTNMMGMPDPEDPVTYPDAVTPEKRKAVIMDYIKDWQPSLEVQRFGRGLHEIESGGKEDPYGEVNKDTGALGKYQFVPYWHWKAILAITGIDVRTEEGKEEFLNNGKVQEYYFSRWYENSLKPQLQSARRQYGAKIAGYNGDEIMALVHYNWRKGVKELADGNLDVNPTAGTSTANVEYKTYLDKFTRGIRKWENGQRGNEEIPAPLPDSKEGIALRRRQEEEARLAEEQRQQQLQQQQAFFENLQSGVTPPPLNSAVMQANSLLGVSPNFKYALGGPVAMTAIQTEIGESILHTDGAITPVNANKRHSKMAYDEVTDIVPAGSYIFSNSNDIRMTKGEAETIKLGVETVPYKEQQQGKIPEFRYLSELFGKQSKMTPAAMAQEVNKRYPVMDYEEKLGDNDIFTLVTNKDNMNARAPYVREIVRFNELERIRQDRSIPSFSSGGSVGSFPDGGAVPRFPDGKMTGGDWAQLAVQVAPSIIQAFGGNKKDGYANLPGQIDPYSQSLMLGSYPLGSYGAMQNIAAQRGAFQQAQADYSALGDKLIEGANRSAGVQNVANMGSTLANIAGQLGQDFGEGIRYDFSPQRTRLQNMMPRSATRAAVEALSTPAVDMQELARTLGPQAADSIAQMMGQNRQAATQAQLQNNQYLDNFELQRLGQLNELDTMQQQGNIPLDLQANQMRNQQLSNVAGLMGGGIQRYGDIETGRIGRLGDIASQITPVMAGLNIQDAGLVGQDYLYNAQQMFNLGSNMAAIKGYNSLMTLGYPEGTSSTTPPPAAGTASVPSGGYNSAIGEMMVDKANSIVGSNYGLEGARDVSAFDIPEYGANAPSQSDINSQINYLKTLNPMMRSDSNYSPPTWRVPSQEAVNSQVDYLGSLYPFFRNPG